MARGHAEALAPMVQEVVGSVEGGVASLDRIAVTTGPGSFTGIRVGLALARAMGLALGVPVVGVSTLAAFAAQLLAKPRQGVIAPAIDARHGSVYFQLFEPSGRPLGPPRCDALRECVRQIGDGPAVLAGDAARLLAAEAHRAGLPYDLEIGQRRPRHRRGGAHGPRPRTRRQSRPPPLRQAAGRAAEPGRADRPGADLTRLARCSSAAQASPVIRPLRVDKAEDCARLHGANFAHPWPAEEMAALISNASTLAAAALDPASGRLRGFVLARLAADEAEILTIAVEPSARGKGVGRALLAESLRQAARAGARAMFLEVDQDNASALALYQRLGFAKVGERKGYYRRKDGQPATAVVMRKTLP